ncbi:hypothetical protein KR093_001169 [Drosophila rubida]|uniref:Nucleoporin NUP42 n=1 Tax=Drosophila rubida TaxID=30044 RepID=A0AAD4K3G7_9MUSC|nr:hypothetical protein KR093_001169 [Drosophila rubida]
MGVCRFFQQGSCRFGTKCHNEHFDVKYDGSTKYFANIKRKLSIRRLFRQYLKTDMEASINSNMWRFSVYGPFKDKPSIPNFIEDQSFEEVRLQAYESRRQNRFDQFHQQYTKEVHDTVNKMKSMLQMTPQIVDMMIKIYETPEGVQPAANNNNPFGFAGNNAAQQQASSIFSKPALGSSGGNIFGSVAAATPAPGNIFGGGGSTNNAVGNNIFSSANSTNIFTQQQQQQQNPFGQPQQQPSIFGQQPQHQQQVVNPFGQPTATAAPAFGFTQPTQATNPSPFGQTNTFMAQQQQPQPGGIFAQAAAATVPNTGNIFAQAVQQQQQPPNGFFGQAAVATTGFPSAQVQMQPAVQQQQQLPQPTDSSIYSRLEDLTAEEIAAFKADTFAPGQVPFKPPPRELC